MCNPFIDKNLFWLWIELGEVIDGKKRQVKITMNQAIVGKWAEKRPGMYQGSHRGKPYSSPLQSLRKILPGLM